VHDPEAHVLGGLIVVGDGGAPAVVITIGVSSAAAALSRRIVVTTVGAPLRWVTPCSRISDQITSPRTSRRQTCVPAIAVTAHGVHQPLQWNIGSVHR
jgi:hypothetical protein